jgi:CheY-like chemotaxis protein
LHPTDSANLIDYLSRSSERNMTASDCRPTVLLVDDNPQIDSVIRPALEDNGFHCVEAVDGDEAEYEVETSKPDLIVLDIELGDPAMDGLDGIPRVRIDCSEDLCACAGPGPTET